MTSARAASGPAFLLSLAALASGCGGGGSMSATLPPTGANVLALTVNGSTCGSVGYVNKPCVGVTVCLPGTSTCTAVNDLVLDTGSYGLRIFKQALQALPSSSLPLTPSGSGTLAECIQYMDGTSHWGPVATADVVLGGEPAIRIPIQVIDSTFGSSSSAGCTSPETDPGTAGYQGILGVGPFPEDCGPGCAAYQNNGIYFACSGSSCTGTNVSLGDQVPNPVARLPVDGNGVVVNLPAVQPGGAPSASGTLVLGIDTQANNSSHGKTAYFGDQYGEIRTSFGGNTTSSFLDTGSNGLFFAPGNSGLPTCASSSFWYCPATTASLTATNSGAFGSPTGTVSFSIGNASTLFGSGNAVFGNLGGPLSSPTVFDFGLPFFLGRPVYVGIYGKTSNLGAGPYYAY